MVEHDIWTVKAALDWTVGYLGRKGDENPRLSAEWLLGEACGLRRIELYTGLERPLSLKERDTLRDYVSRRGRGEPLQYITGEVAFRHVAVKVRAGVLIPRPETEVLVSEALALLPAVGRPRALDSRMTEAEAEELLAARAAQDAAEADRPAAEPSAAFSDVPGPRASSASPDDSASVAAPLFVAANEAKATADEVRAALAEAGADVRPVSIDGVEVPGCLQVAEPRALQDGRVRRLFSQGKLLVSDAASQLVAASVLPAHMPASFLEIGSGRGTKTILLQSGALRAYGSQMELVALDNHAFKTDLLRERAEEYGVHVADAVTGDATMLGAVLGGRRFDAVFIDAPCSGLGTLRRHPEIRWRLTEEHLGELAALGLSLLRSAAGHVARGGQLAYATCTVTHTENNAVVKRFLESPEGADFELAPIAGKACVATRLAPGTPDAHFAVRFARKR